MSFDLPERSPLATLSIIDLSSSQVTCPCGHGGSWLLWPCLKHPCAQRSEDFRGRVGPRGVLCIEQPRVLQGSAQHQPGPFWLFKIQAPFLVKPCSRHPSQPGCRAGMTCPSGTQCDCGVLKGDVESWIRPGGFPDPGLAGLGQGKRLSRGGREQSGSRLAWLWLETTVQSLPAPSLSPKAISLWQSQVLPSSLGADRRGLLWILDEEVLIPGSGDEAAFDRLCSYFVTKGPSQEGKSGSARLLILWHRHLALAI